MHIFISSTTVASSYDGYPFFRQIRKSEKSSPTLNFCTPRFLSTNEISSDTVVRNLQFALPGSSGGVTDAWDGILKHQLDINHKPCNFVELFPRLKEK